jgi:CheY-like chemotaxis protein
MHQIEMEEERMELLDSQEDGIKLALRLSLNLKNSLDGCYDYLGPSIQVESKPNWNEIIKLHNRGIRLRFITEVTKQNIVYCKEMMKYVEVRHLDAVKGNFGISDGKHYLGHIIHKEGEPPRRLIYINIKGFVRQQQYLFDNLWSRAVPAEHRIREIEEEGMLPDVIDILKDPFEIINTLYRLVRAAKDEILIIFHTANALRRQQKAGGLDLLVESAFKSNFNEFDDSSIKAHSFSNPVDALLDFTPGFYDMLLVDINMPMMDGFELVEKLLRKDANMKICFMTAGEVNTDAVREVHSLKSIGCFITKPITTDVLVKRIRAELE